MIVRVRAGAATDPGAHRAANEDAHLTADRLYLVADGMGGHAAGEVASALAVVELGALDGGVAGPEDVRERVLAANEAILAEAGRDPAKSGMGTTVAGVCLADLAGTAHWVVFTVGDSRIYRYADGALSQLTVDHTQAAELAVHGLPFDAADGRPSANVLTRALGTSPAPEPDLLVFPPTAGERFLLCSDGLTGELDDETIAGVLAATADPVEAARVLVAMAVAAGGRDNVTAVVVDHCAPARHVDAGRTAPRAVG